MEHIDARTVLFKRFILQLFTFAKGLESQKKNPCENEK